MYAKLEEIKATIERTRIFQPERVILGEQFTLGANQVPVCLIKSGFGELSVNGAILNANAHIMVVISEKKNVEKKLYEHLKTIIRDVGKIDNISPVAFTTNEDVFEPYGVVFTPVPPYGAFRLDLEIGGFS